MIEPTTPKPDNPVTAVNRSPMDKHVILLTGESTTGKSTSLRNLRNPEGVLYLNCEVGKNLPFKSKFKSKIINDPHEIPDYFALLKTNEDIHTVVIDSLSFLMNMYHRMYVKPAGAGDAVFRAWDNYKSFFETLMDTHVKNCTQNVIILSHVTTTKSEDPNKDPDVSASIKGNIAKNEGVEASFTTVLSTKKITLNSIILPNADPAKSRKLQDFSGDLLTITEDEELAGLKHVIQTNPIAGSSGEKVRSPLGMFTFNQSFIDGDIQVVLDHMENYYNTP